MQYPARTSAAAASRRVAVLALVGWMAAFLTVVGVWNVRTALAASSGTWSQSGYTMVGQTNNPRDQYTSCSCSQCGGTCGGITYYRSASFTQTPNSGAWVGALNQAGDWCAGGGGSFPKQTNGWNWLWNQPNTWVSAMTGWVSAENCTSGHSYLVRGTHNLQNGDGSVNFSYVTEVY